MVSVVTALSLHEVFSNQWLPAVLGLAGLLMLLRRRRSLLGTTLTAPWRWAVFSLLVLAANAVWLGPDAAAPSAWASHARFAAATTTFCPWMALLGAKRPQDRAWQFIVLALLGILLLPVGTALVFRPGELLLHAAHRWFLLILLVFALFTGLPTRFWLASLLAATGQVLLLGEQLPEWFIVWLPVSKLPIDQRTPAGLALIVAAVGLWTFLVPRGRRSPSPIDRLWLDFRDWFGAVWALRVAERFNAASALYGWGAWLGWSGLRFTADQGEPSPEIQQAMQVNLRILLRRFVSPEWIAERLDRP